jgi:hypothetical protein
MDYEDMSTRKLKGKYLRAVRSTWRNVEYRSYVTHWKEKYWAPYNRARDIAAELKRRGWDLFG